MSELVFGVSQKAGGKYIAECLGEDNSAQGHTSDQSRSNVLEAVTGFCLDSKPPRRRDVKGYVCYPWNFRTTDCEVNHA